MRGGAVASGRRRGCPIYFLFLQEQIKGIIIIRTGPVAAGVRVYSSVSHL
jgi:hypothetical protein